MSIASDVILYQMGKVGSKSVHHALHKRNVQVIHAHWMCGEFPDSEFPTTKPNIVEIIAEDTAPPMKVISLVREPIGRSISAYFQRINTYSDNYRHKSAVELQKELIDNYPVEYPDLWFEKELMSVFDFDPFSIPFDHSKGYLIQEAGRHKLLIIRLEDANKILPKVIWKFLGVRNVRMEEQNMFKKRHNGTNLGNKYRELEKLKFPKSFVDRNYGLKYARHFYTPEEIVEFREKWEEK
jgi:hypothetical protein